MTDISQALAVRNLSFSYGLKPVLSGVTIEVAPGSFTVLLGPNGAGKTTLFSLITRLLEPGPGAISIQGLDVVGTGSRALAPIGIVFQQATLDLDLSVEQNLRYFAALHGLDRRLSDTRIAEALGALSMSDRRQSRVRELSGGQRRRVEIARAFLPKPRLLLLDEPTVGLDIPTRAAIVEHMHAICREQSVAVLWATHLIDEVHDDDSIVVLDAGRVVGRGSVAEIVQQAGVESLGEAFNRLTVGKAGNV
ncbi:MAG: ATP-binding cassette domain-containing protein [Rhodospirillales bacterium]|nr:ATP-binding cassette domain-containing protein [Rhodospirillales bacterium]MSP80518.1 ATP-binding cassette domain-containing protein [Rhodospirillales bacterium]